MITLKQPDWTFTFDNGFAHKLHDALAEHTPQESTDTFRPCNCFSVIIDSVAGSEHPKARLSEICVASRNCIFCKLLVKLAERVHDNAEPNSELVRDGGTISIGKTGQCILRLCSDIGQWL